jgi:hypothetical protein
MAGEYGIGQGLVQGMQLATQGMLKAEDIKNNRLQMQMKAQEYTQRMQMNQQAMQMNQQSMQYKELQFQQLQSELQQVKMEQAKKDAWTYLAGFEQTKDANVLNMAKQNQFLAKLLNDRGIVSFSNISDLSDEKLKSLGIDKTKDLDMNIARPVVINKADGSSQVVDLMKSLYLTTGYLPMLGKQKLDEITIAQAARQEKESSQIGEFKQQAISELQTKVDSGEISAADAWLLLNGKSTTKESVKPSEIKAQLELNKMVESDSILDAYNKNPDEIISIIKNSKKSDKVKFGDKELSTYEIAGKIEDSTIERYGKLDTSYMNELRGKKAVLEGSNRILEKLDKIKDWNIGTKVSVNIENVVGDFISSLTDDVKTNTKSGTQAIKQLDEVKKDLPEESRQYIEAYVFPIIADYIKAMSGAAVSEKERTAYMTSMTAGWMSDKSAFTKSLTGFSDSINDNYSGMLDTIAQRRPQTYLDMKVDMPEKPKPLVVGGKEYKVGDIVTLKNGTKVKIVDSTGKVEEVK